MFTKELVLLLKEWFWTPAWMALVLLFCPNVAAATSIKKIRNILQYLGRSHDCLSWFSYRSIQVKLELGGRECGGRNLRVRTELYGTGLKSN